MYIQIGPLWMTLADTRHIIKTYTALYKTNDMTYSEHFLCIVLLIFSSLVNMSESKIETICLRMVQTEVLVSTRHDSQEVILPIFVLPIWSHFPPHHTYTIHLTNTKPLSKHTKSLNSIDIHDWNPICWHHHRLVQSNINRRASAKWD